LDSPYLYLEDLDNPRTREFVERHNRRLRELLNGLPDEILPEVLRWYGVDYVYTYEVCESKAFVVIRGKEGFRVIEKPGDRVVFSRPGVVVWGVYPSPDCSLLGVGYTIGSDEGVIEVIDTRNNATVDRLEGYVYSIAWRSDGRYYYLRMYRKEPPPDGGDVPSERIILRDMESGREEVVWGKGLQRGYLINIHPIYEENTLIILVSKGWSEGKLIAGPLDDPGKWNLLLSPGAPLSPAGASRNSVYAVVYDDPGTGRIIEVSEGRIREVVPAHVKYPIEEAVAHDGGITVNRLIDAKSTIELYTPDGIMRDRWDPEEPSTVVFMKRWGDHVLGQVESFNKPMGLYDLHGMHSLHESSVNLGLEVMEDWADSFDGTRIHYFIAKEPGIDAEKVLLYGYGGFGISLTPGYIGHLKPILDRGFTYVMVNLRGGREYGEKWHDMGRRLNKQKVFEDYRAVARKLKSQGYRVAGWGSSNGGLLIATVITQEPELLDAAVIGYPVIDMLRFHKLYIGSLWIDEYGDPEKPEIRDYLLTYSPMHNVRPGRYPATLIYTGLHDDRVHPSHALRFTTTLEEAGAPVYLRVETGSGHMGADPKIKARELADIQAFLVKTLG